LDEDISSNILKFADDTKIFKEVMNSTDCIKLQADLDKLVLWAQKWQMEFNVNKCKGMHVGNSDDSSTYYMEWSELTDVSFEKDLGVWISVKRIKRTIRFTDTRLMLSLYKTLVRPHAEYCITLHYVTLELFRVA